MMYTCILGRLVSTSPSSSTLAVYMVVGLEYLVEVPH